jgi:hypothetical protein
LASHLPTSQMYSLYHACLDDKVFRKLGIAVFHSGLASVSWCFDSIPFHKITFYFPYCSILEGYHPRTTLSRRARLVSRSRPEVGAALVSRNQTLGLHATIDSTFSFASFWPSLESLEGARGYRDVSGLHVAVSIGKISPVPCTHAFQLPS